MRMKKRILISIVIAAIAIVSLGVSPAFAYDWNDADADVNVSDIEVDGATCGTALVGSTIIASGTVEIVSDAHAMGLFPTAKAGSGAGYFVTSPGSVMVASGGNSEYDYDWGWFYAEADAGQVYSWSATMTLEQEGVYSLEHFGGAYSECHGWPFGSDFDWDFSSFGCSIIALPGPFQGLSGWEGSGGFQVVCNCWPAREYPWEGGSSDGHVLGKTVDLEGRNNGHTIRLIIPKGTIINENMPRGYKFLVQVVGNDNLGYKLRFEPDNITFSQPITVYELLDGEWVELVTFTAIVNGIPVFDSVPCKGGGK